MKVYCEDCKYSEYLSNLVIIPDGYYCNALKDTGKPFLRRGGVKIVVHENSEEFPNKTGDCPYYKRKWWRFFAPKGK